MKSCFFFIRILIPILIRVPVLAVKAQNRIVLHVLHATIGQATPSTRLPPTCPVLLRGCRRIGPSRTRAPQYQPWVSTRAPGAFGGMWPTPSGCAGVWEGPKFVRAGPTLEPISLMHGTTLCEMQEPRTHTRGSTILTGVGRKFATCLWSVRNDDPTSVSSCGEPPFPP